MADTTNPTLRTIKNYIQTCGGCISVENLIEDFRVGFNSDIPFNKFGYSNVIDLLTNIPGISVKCIEGEYYAILRNKSISNHSAPDSICDDISSLCITMTNNLLVECDRKRKVTVQSKPVFTRKNPVLRHYNTFSSVKCDEFLFSTDSSDNVMPDHVTTPLNNSIFSRYNTSAKSDENEFSQTSNHDIIPEYPCSSYSPAMSGDYESGFESDDKLNLSSYCDDSYDNTTTNYETTHIEPYLDLSHYFTDRNDVETTLFYGEPVPDDWLPQNRPTPEKLDSKLINQLRTIINSHKKPLSCMDVELRYHANFNEVLPKHWLATLIEANVMYIENINSDVTIYPNRSFISNPTISVLPAIEYPDHIPWNIHITAVVSTSCVWFRLRENNYEKKYEILELALQKHYENHTPGSLNFVTSGELYVACVNRNFIRVTIVHSKGDIVTCLDIDSGIMHTFNQKNLFALHEKFTNIPAMASPGTLTGLERFDKCSYIKCRLMAMILNKHATAAVDYFDRNGKSSLNLFVQNSSQNMNINRAIIQIAEEKLTIPKLEVDQIYQVNIINLNESEAKVQILSPCLCLLLEALSKTKEIIDAHENKQMLFAKSMLDIQLHTEVYLIKDENESWQRIIAKEFASTTRVVVLFIDLGVLRTVDVDGIVTSSDFPDTLTYIPPQAVDVRIVKTDCMVLLYMFEKYKNKLYSMKVVQKEPQLCVQMYLKLPNETTKPINNVQLLNSLYTNSNVFQKV